MKLNPVLFHRSVARLGMLACCAIPFVTAGDGRAGDRGRGQPISAGDVVAAMNALAPSDIAIATAASTACAIDRLPGSRDAILPLVPVAHRQLIDECVRGRLRLKRRQADLDLASLIDEAADRPDCVAEIRAFFAGRPVDVAVGAGLSDGPYPIAFDWAVVLDPRSGTLFSFVLNCRD